MERITQQIEELEEWKANQIKLMRRVLLWLTIGLVLFAAGGVWSTWRISHLGQENRMALIAQNEFDNKISLETYHANLLRWQACVDRNELLKQQLRQDERQLTSLIAAHKADGNRRAAAAWTEYLRQGQETKDKLPSCGSKPRPPEIEENVP